MNKKEIKIKYIYEDDGGKSLEKAFDIVFEAVLQARIEKKKNKKLDKTSKFCHYEQGQKL